MDFSTIVKKAAQQNGAVIEEEAGILKMVMPVPAEPEPRSQLVIAREITGLGFAPDESIAAFASVVGKLKDKIDIKTLLRENENMVYAKISIDEEDQIVVYSLSLLKSATEEEMGYM